MPTSLQMVPDSGTKRKSVRRGTTGSFIFFSFALTGLTASSFAASEAAAQTQANPQPPTLTPTPTGTQTPRPNSGPAPVPAPAPTPPPSVSAAPKPPGTSPVPVTIPPRPALPPPNPPNALPPPGKTPAVIPAPPPVGKPFPLEVDLPRSQGPRMDLAGYRGGVFLRDSEDSIRFHVRGRLQLDFHSFFASGKDELEAAAGAAFLSPRLVVRRARIEVGADLWRRWYALFGVDFGAQPLTNPTGGQEVAAAPPGQPPTANSARFAPFQTPSPSAQIANAYVDYTFLRQLHIMIGQHQAPFSMENRTGNNSFTWLERNMAIRSFVVPNGKEMGAVLWGDVNDVKTVSYEVGVFLGDGPNRPQVDSYPDFIGRVFARPLARSGQSRPYDKIQVGLSFHGGARDPKFVAYDYPAITTAFGWTLWNPRYKDSLERTIRVLPSGRQLRVGGELRVPINRFDFRAEAYWVNNGTREAVDGLQMTNTERFGNVQGLGYYAQISFWPWGDPSAIPDPGFSRPPRLDLTKTPDTDKQGIELSAMFGGIDAEYDGASRDGDYDAFTPGAPLRTKSISVHEVGLGATYWHTQLVRLSLNYFAYHTVGSGEGDNLAKVPGNFVENPTSSARTSTWHHELGMRLGLAF